MIVKTYEGFLDYIKDKIGIEKTSDELVDIHENDLPWDKLEIFLNTTSPFDIREILREVTDITGDPRYIKYSISTGVRQSGAQLITSRSYPALLQVNDDRFIYKPYTMKGGVHVDNSLSEFTKIKSIILNSLQYTKRKSKTHIYFLIDITTELNIPLTECRLAAGGIQDMCEFESNDIVIDDEKRVTLLFKF